MNMKKLERDYPDLLWYGRKRILGMPISFTHYILTKKKLYTRKGLLSIKEDQIDLYKATDLSVELPLGQRIFGCGTINVISRDKDHPTKVVRFIKNPREVLRKLEDVIEDQRTKYSIRGRDMIGESDVFEPDEFEYS